MSFFASEFLKFEGDGNLFGCDFDTPAKKKKSLILKLNTNNFFFSNQHRFLQRILNKIMVIERKLAQICKPFRQTHKITFL